MRGRRVLVAVLALLLSGLHPQAAHAQLPPEPELPAWKQAIAKIEAAKASGRWAEGLRAKPGVQLSDDSSASHRWLQYPLRRASSPALAPTHALDGLARSLVLDSDPQVC